MKDAPTRLGRGLAALLGETASSAHGSGSPGVMTVDRLDPNPFQPRGLIRDEDLAELVASIRARGVLQPILVRPHGSIPGRYQIVAGERRWRAAKLAGLGSVPCLVRDMPDTDASAAALVENLQRKDLNPIEEAQGYRRLIDDFGLTQEELGSAIGKSRSHVANLLRLLALPPEMLDYVRSGALSAGHARAALACADPLAAGRDMIARGMSVRQAEAYAAPKPPLETGRAKQRGTLGDGMADLRAVEADLAERLGLSVSISFNGQGGTISLRYQTLDQLDHVVARLGRS